MSSDLIQGNLYPAILSKREYYAAQALKTFGNATFGWITDQTDMDRILEERARIAFKQADAMIRASEKS